MVSHRRRKQTLKAMCCVNHSGRQFETVDLDAYKSCIRTFVNSKLIVHKDGMVDKSACNSKFSLHHTSTSGLCNECNHSLTLSDDESHAGLVKKPVHGHEDGTRDLISIQLHSRRWTESTSAPPPPSYLGTTWR